MNIEHIERDRNNKVKSLFMDFVDSEVGNLKQFADKLSFTSVEIEKLNNTLEFALKQYYGDSPLCKYYVCHPLRVAVLAAEWMLESNDKNIDLIIASIIHNVIEKNVISYAEIEEEYGAWVANTISAITVDRIAQEKSNWAENYYSRLYSLDRYGQLLKAFDKFDNIYSLCLNPDAKVRKDYLDEIERYIKPIISKYASSYLNYFDSLVCATRKLGHRPKEYFI